MEATLETRDESGPEEGATTDALIGFIRPALRGQSVYAVRHREGISFKMNQNESPFDLPEPLKRRATERLLARPWNRYPTDYADPLREAVAAHLGVGEEQLILSNGSNDLINTVGLALIDAGDQTPVVLPEPVFSLYPKAVAVYGGRAVAVPSREDLSVDPDRVVDAARKARAPLIVLVTPNSPTGAAIPHDGVEQIAAQAPGFVLVDEAYYEFSDEPSILDRLDRYPNLLLMRTFSKAVGLAGVRLGFLIGHADVIREIRKARVPFVISQLTEAVALTVLEEDGFLAEQVARIKTARGELGAALAGIPGVRVMPSQTNFIIFRTPLATADLVERLAARGVLIRDVGGYPQMDGFVRVSVGSPKENQAFLSSLKDVLGSEAQAVPDEETTRTR